MNKSLQNKKILWVNPSFLDYRIPLYDELNKRTNGNFHLVYSRSRIPERCDVGVKKVLGDNAHPLDKEKVLGIGDQGNDFSNTSFKIPFPKGLYKKIKDVNANAIIAEGFFQFTPWAVAYSWLHRKPLYIAYERTAHTERNASRLRRWYRKFVSLFVTGYIANGSLTKEYLISQGVKPECIQTGGMCADSKGLAENVSKMTSEEVESFRQDIVVDKGNGLVYLIVGRMIELKGVNYVLDVWQMHLKNHPDDRLVIAGGGPLLDEYMSKYQDKSIVFTGNIDYSQIYKYYAIADVFVIATLEDNWSLVVPEAMACGLPIACSIYNGCYPELVRKDENGITFDPFRQETVLQALEYFHHQNLVAFGEASRRIEKGFNPEATAQNVLKMLANIR